MERWNTGAGRLPTMTVVTAMTVWSQDPPWPPGLGRMREMGMFHVPCHTVTMGNVPFHIGTHDPMFRSTQQHVPMFRSTLQHWTIFRIAIRGSVSQIVV